MQTINLNFSASKRRPLTEHINSIHHHVYRPLRSELGQAAELTAGLDLDEPAQEAFERLRLSIERHCSRTEGAYFPVLRSGHRGPVVDAMAESHRELVRAAAMLEARIGEQPGAARFVELFKLIRRLIANEQALLADC